jgi:hypothetical protein
MAERSGHQLGGVAITDQRSADEAVMIMWLVPASGSDEQLLAVLERHVIVGVLHIRREAKGLSFDSSGTPILMPPDGMPVMPLAEAAMSTKMRGVLDRLRKRLSRPADGEIAALSGFAEKMAFHIFEKGEAVIGPGWTLDYAGRAYPLIKQPLS